MFQTAVIETGISSLNHPLEGSAERHNPLLARAIWRLFRSIVELVLYLD